ncbi:MAG: hypothetical protein ACREJO_17860 [Phycisphaerales bacterium]
MRKLLGQLGSDITDPRLLVLKGVLFVVLGVTASGMLIAAFALREQGVTLAWWCVLVLHGLAVWAWCRAYYFAFYVIERYLPPACRNAGLVAAVRAVMRRGARETA